MEIHAQDTDDMLPGFIERMIESGVLVVSQKDAIVTNTLLGAQKVPRLYSLRICLTTTLQAKNNAPKLDKTKMKESHRRLVNSTSIVSPSANCKTTIHSKFSQLNLMCLNLQPYQENEFGLPEGSLPEDIVGGGDVEEDMPFLVSFGKEALEPFVPGGHACGGSVIMPNVILSSARE